jgi:DUF1009 family protein
MKKVNIALIAGQGNAAMVLRNALKAQGMNPFILAYRGITPKELVEGCDHTWLNLGQVQKSLDCLNTRNIQHIVLAGKFYRPQLMTLYPDAQARKILYRLARHWFGDNALLKVLMQCITELGLIIVRPQDILPEMLTSRGGIGVDTLCESVQQDLQTGVQLLKCMSPWDVGQGLAIQSKRILGIEGAEGTDACILRCGALAERVPEASKPIYVKMAKIGQSYDTDLPVIGIDTIHTLHRAGFQGIAIEADSVLVVQQQIMEKTVHNYGIFVWKF